MISSINQYFNFNNYIYGIIKFMDYDKSFAVFKISLYLNTSNIMY